MWSTVLNFLASLIGPLSKLWGRRPSLWPEVVLVRRQKVSTLAVDVWNSGKAAAKWTQLELSIRPPADLHLDAPFDAGTAGAIEAERPSVHRDSDGRYRLYKARPAGQAAAILHAEDSHLKYLEGWVQDKELSDLPDAVEVSWTIRAENARKREGRFVVYRSDFSSKKPKKLLLVSKRRHTLLGEPRVLV